MNSPRLSGSFRAFAVLWAFALVCSGALFAQASLGSISGLVKDQAGAVVPGAKVTLINEGTGATATATSASEGGFNFPQLQPGLYTVKIEMANFRAATYKGVKVDAARTYSLNATLQVGTQTESVEVNAGAELINTNTLDISSTVSGKQMQDLPLNGRNPIELIRNQAGVAPNARTATTINGGRPAWTNITQDGISINDNFIRTNAVDFVPNRPSTDQIAEFTVTTSGQGVDSQFGASQVKLSTPSGTKTYHGSVYEYNRNSFLGANSWVNKNFTDPTKVIARPFLNRNQFGARIGGPIWKNKLFGYGYYEGLRQKSSPTSGSGVGVAIPRNSDLLTGVYRFNVNGVTQTINVLNPGGSTCTSGSSSTQGACSAFAVDPTIQAQLLSKFYAASNVNQIVDLNVGRYIFNQSRGQTRNQWGWHFDYDLNAKNHLEYIQTRAKEVVDRTDIDGVNMTPKAPQDGIGRLYVAAWRWSITPTFQNEARAGINDTEANFHNTEDYGGVVYAGLPLGLNYPLGGQISSTGGNVNDYAGGNPLLPQGRRTVTFQYGDSVSMTRGNHNVKFGVSFQQVRVRPYNDRGKLPVLTFGFSGTAPAGSLLTSTTFSNLGCTTANGCSASTEAANANALRTFLAGIISQTDQRFQVSSKTSGFIPGLSNIRHYQQDLLNLYYHDTWRMTSKFTLNAGLKWEYYAPLRERDSLALTPVLNGTAMRQALLDPNATVDFVGKDFNHPDYNNFGPTIGFAWDPWGDGKTSIRMGYGLEFVSDDNLTVARGALDNNAGLQSDGRVSAQFATPGTATLPTTTFKVPRTMADQLALSVASTIGGIDPNLRNPLVHNINFGVQRQVGWNTVVEARYVATIGRDLNRTINLNQIKTLSNQAFLDDFNRARNNLFNCGNLAGTGTCSAPAQPLTLLNTANYGNLTTSTVITAVRNRAPADLINFYLTGSASSTVRANARTTFLPDNGIYESLYTYNGASSDYHSLQAEVRHNFSHGLSFQSNYTFSKLLTDSIATSQTRVDVYLDNARPQIDRGRSEYDLKHALNNNFTYELPFGRGKMFLGNANGLVDRVVGGWQTSGIVRWQSGSPISIISGRGSFNRAGRAGEMAANSTLTVDQIKGLLGIHRVNGFAYWIDPAVLNPNSGTFFNSAVGAEALAGGNTAGFTGQVFFNPDATQLGTLPLKAFDTPGVYSLDLSFKKTTKITEKVNTSFEASMFNLFNSSTYFLSRNQNINSIGFMQVFDNLGPRVIQLGLRVSF